jgi:hypothetical protein
MAEHEIPDRHRRVIRALEAGGPAVPDTLHVPDFEPAPRRATWRPAAVAAVAAAALLAVIVALLTGPVSGPAPRTLAALAEQNATAAAPPSRGALLNGSFEGVAFPDWSAQFGWRATGSRARTIDGRRTATVFYGHHGHRIAYTVVSGDALEPPAGADQVRVGGVEMHRFRDGDRDAVMFERNGRTCVLAGQVITPATLVKLASWRGGGAISF